MCFVARCKFDQLAPRNKLNIKGLSKKDKRKDFYCQSSACLFGRGDWFYYFHNVLKDYPRFFSSKPLKVQGQDQVQELNLNLVLTLNLKKITEYIFRTNHPCPRGENLPASKCLIFREAYTSFSQRNSFREEAGRFVREIFDST